MESEICTENLKCAVEEGCAIEKITVDPWPGGALDNCSQLQFTAPFRAV